MGAVEGAGREPAEGDSRERRGWWRSPASRITPAPSVDLVPEDAVPRLSPRAGRPDRFAGPRGEVREERRPRLEPSPGRRSPAPAAPPNRSPPIENGVRTFRRWNPSRPTSRPYAPASPSRRRPREHPRSCGPRLVAAVREHVSTLLLPSEKRVERDPAALEAPPRAEVGHVVPRQPPQARAPRRDAEGLSVGAVPEPRASGADEPEGDQVGAQLRLLRTRRRFPRPVKARGSRSRCPSPGA